mmetsp:Transcript_99014/g.206397  ORF Transcript_99014/g.206397 Transcript_99014/m.206397 type:complete len:112 (-) Transcript_99014:563-898(-)
MEKLGTQLYMRHMPKENNTLFETSCSRDGGGGHYFCQLPMQVALQGTEVVAITIVVFAVFAAPSPASASGAFRGRQIKLAVPLLSTTARQSATSRTSLSGSHLSRNSRSIM